MLRIGPDDVHLELSVFVLDEKESDDDLELEVGGETFNVERVEAGRAAYVLFRKGVRAELE
jgi:hypothetical protein